MLDNFRPDWVVVWTAEYAEKELADFKFTGPGWYHLRGDTILVIARERTPDKLWHQKAEAGERFEFNVYNGRNPAEAFNRIVNAPTRE